MFADHIGIAELERLADELESGLAEPRPGGRGRSHERRRAARGQARLRVRRLRRGRQDDHLGGDRARHGGPRAPRSRWSRSTRPSDSPTRSDSRSSRTSRAACEPERLAAAGLEIKGELWAMMLDPKRTFDELIERLAPTPERAEEIKANRVYRELSTAVSGSQEFTAIAKLYELDQRGRLRPARARHAAVAQRARLPRRARPADLVSRGPRAQGVPAPDGLRDARARAAAPARCSAACAGSPASTCSPTCPPSSGLLGEHDRGLQRARRAGRADAARPTPPRSC